MIARNRTRAALLGAGALLAIGVAAACDDNIRSHLYAAAQYEQAAGCMDPYTAVDVVDGDDTGSTCSPVCLANGGVYYVSTMCPPYPALFTVTAGGGSDAAVDPVCAAALAAYAARTSCAPDGGADGGEAGASDAAGDSSTTDGSDAASADASSDSASAGDAPIDAAADATAD